MRGPGQSSITRAAAHDRLVGGNRGFQMDIIDHRNAVVNAYQKIYQALRTAFPCSKGGLALALLMLGVFADNHHAALALDDLALFADGLHRRTDFHGNTSLG